jgi:hypothetical protein
METYTFEAILKRPEGVGTYLDIPFAVRRYLKLMVLPTWW